MIGTHVNTSKTDFRTIYCRDEKSWMPDILVQLIDAKWILYSLSLVPSQPDEYMYQL